MTHPESQAELAACPFCGCAMHIGSTRDWHKLYGPHDDDCVFIDDYAMIVPASDESCAAMVRDWNRRAAQSAGSREDIVSLPQSADQAETMLRAAAMYLTEHAPERLKVPPIAAVPVTRLDVMSLIRAQMHRVYASAIDREDVDTRYMQEIEDAIRAIAAAPQSPEAE